MLRRIVRFLVLLVSRPRIELLEHPHGGVALAGGRTALMVRVSGNGRLGQGANARDISGGFAGVVFVDVPAGVGRTTVEVAVRSVLFRHTRTIVLDVIAAPPRAPTAPSPPTIPVFALPVRVPALPPVPCCHEVPRP